MQAGNDHTRAESDHTRAESDHAAVEVYVDSLGAFDISSYHATGDTLATYSNLSAALGTNGANVPADIRKGGMSVKFVQSSDNKYVQARCMAQNFTTDTTQWQGVDDEPTAGSNNLVKSGGVDKSIYKCSHPYYEESLELVQEGIDLDYGLSAGTGVSASITKDNGKFTFAKIDGSEYTNAYIGALDVKNDGLTYVLELDYNLVSASPDLKLQIRDTNKVSGSNIIKSASFDGNEGHMQIELPYGSNYIVFNSANYYNNSSIELDNIRLIKFNDTSIKEKFDNIDSALLKGSSDILDSSCILKEYNIEELSQRPYSIDSNGYYGSDSTYKHSLVEVNKDDIIKVKANANSNAVLYFFTNADYPTSSSAAPIVAVDTDTYKVEIEPGNEKTFKVPGNARLLYVARGISEVNTPSFLGVYTPKCNIESPYFGREIKSIGCNGYRPTTEGVTKKSSISYLFPIKNGRTYTLVLSNVSGHAYVGMCDEIPHSGTSCEFKDYAFIVTGTTFKVTIKENKDGFLLVNNYSTSLTSLFEAKMYDNLDIYTIEDSNGKKVVSELANVIGQLHFEEVLSITNRNYSITNDNGAYGNSTTYKHALIPVEAYQYVKITARDNTNCTFGFLNEDEGEEIANTPIPYSNYSSKQTIEQGATAFVKTPIDAKYLVLYTGKNNANKPTYIGIGTFSNDNLPSIVDNNDVKKTKNILSQLRGATKTSNYQPLMLLHFSDIHSNAGTMNRINQYRNYFKNFIDDTVFTGDMLADNWSHDSSFWTNEDCGDILTVLGNHDTATGTGDSRDWHAKQGVEAYNRFFAPFVSNWNIIQPENAETNGYCFYYKDYAEKLVRLIVIDPFNTDTDYSDYQQTWFQQVLEDAITNDMSVVVASHYSILPTRTIECPFSRLNLTLTPDTAISRFYSPYITEFIKNGGKFVCWLVGHSHMDRIQVLSEDVEIDGVTTTINQLCVCVADSLRSDIETNSNSHILTTLNAPRTLDLFNIVAIDTYFKKITLFRVGSDYDKWGRHICTCCIDYEKGELISFS